MHYFLTGEIQVGKSTAIRKTLGLLNVKCGGFCTYFGPDRHEAKRSLYMSDASLPHVFGEENVIVRFSEDGPPSPLISRFDALGVHYLEEAREKAKIIVMDECGSFERDAFEFQNAIMQTLDGNIPVLGVLKKTASGWVDKIIGHRDVVLITVNEHNRDCLPLCLSAMLKMYI